MIFVCEPLCKKFSHEKVNSGFLTTIAKAYPEEEVLLFADKTHSDNLREVLIIDNINLKFKNIDVDYGNSHTVFGFILLFYKMYKLLNEVSCSREKRLFFLSYNTHILFVLIFLTKNIKRFEEIKFLIVLHGSFESIATNKVSNNRFENKKNEKQKSVFEKINKNGFFGSLRIVIKKIIEIVESKIALMPRLTKMFFDEKAILEKTNKNFRFLALSPHVKNNATKYISGIDIHYTYLPTNFKQNNKTIINDNLKLAVFGYGNNSKLVELATILKSYNVKNLEIRIVGMDNRGIEDFDFIKCMSPGKPLLRSQMEQFISDIDAFLILYPLGTYELSCSGSIFEAFSYEKPIIHLKNTCISFYNNKEQPIGLESSSVENLAQIILQASNDRNVFKEKLKIFKANIARKREEYCIDANVHYFKAAFEFE